MLPQQAVLYAEDISAYRIDIKHYYFSGIQPELPSGDIFLTSSIDTTYSLSLDASLTNFQPVYFLFSNELLKNRLRHKFLFGDIQLREMANLKGRGMNYSLSSAHSGFGFFTGKQQDMQSAEYPEFIHNRGIYSLYGTFNVSYTDTTMLYFSGRFDDCFYSPYISKQFLGIYHKSRPFEALRINLAGKVNRNLTYYNTVHDYAGGSWRVSYTDNGLYASLTGRYMPRYSSEMDFLMYRRGYLTNTINASYRITDELSVSGIYSDMNLFPSDSSSYERFGGRVSTSIGFLPSISAMYDYSRYTDDRSGKKDDLFGIEAVKRIDKFLFRSTYRQSSSAYLARREFDLNAGYIFGNGARTRADFRYYRENLINNYRTLLSVDWSPVKPWNIESGIDFLFRVGSNIYVKQFLNSSVTLKNASMVNSVSFIYSNGFLLQLGTQLSIYGPLTEMHIGNLSGIIFYDKNSNGKFDRGEETVNGIYVTLDDSLRTKTDSRGRYSFHFLYPKKYSLSIEKSNLPAYFDTKEHVTVEVNNFSNSRYDLPLIRLGSVSGVIFNDYNGNGIKDDGEDGISGIAVRIKNTNIYTFSDMFGNYTLPNLASGSYIIEVPYLPEGYALSIPDLIMYISVDKVKSDFTVDFGIIKESKPVRKKVF